MKRKNDANYFAFAQYRHASSNALQKVGDMSSELESDGD